MKHHEFQHFSSRAPALKLIVAYKVLKGALMLVLGIMLVHEQLLGRVQAFADDLAHWFSDRPWLPALGQDISHWLIHQATNRHIEFAIGLVLADAVSTWIEGLGLHFRQRWAAWWVVLATGALIPLEVYELARHATVLRGTVLLINLSIVAWLVRRVLIEQRPVRTAS